MKQAAPNLVLQEDEGRAGSAVAVLAMLTDKPYSEALRWPYPEGIGNGEWGWAPRGFGAWTSWVLAYFLAKYGGWYAQVRLGTRDLWKPWSGAHFALVDRGDDTRFVVIDATGRVLDPRRGEIAALSSEFYDRIGPVTGLGRPWLSSPDTGSVRNVGRTLWNSADALIGGEVRLTKTSTPEMGECVEASAVGYDPPLQVWVAADEEDPMGLARLYLGWSLIRRIATTIAIP